MFTHGNPMQAGRHAFFVCTISWEAKMIENITKDNIKRVKRRKRGYIVNETEKTERPYGRYVCAHNMAQYSKDTCTFTDSPQATKFYASTLQEARTEANQRWPNLPFKECDFCR